MVKKANYCKDCNVDICEECKKELAIFLKDRILGKHDTHTLIDLSDIIKKIEEIKKLYEKKKEEFKISTNIKTLVNYLLEHYEENLS